MYEIIIFDLDGTLLDTLDDLHASVNFALTKFGYPTRTKEEVRGFVGNGIALLVKRAIGKETGDFSAVLQAFKEHYGAHCAENTKPYDGVLEMLETLKNKGIKSAVLSNKADFATKKLAKQYFDGLLCMAVGENEEMGIRKKPAPDSLFKVLETQEIQGEKAIYVGDSEVDIQTAANAGVSCISVTWGFKEKEFLVKNGGTLFANSPQEILAIVENKRD